jgi:hypothetical protein
MKKMMCWLFGHRGGSIEKSDGKDGYGHYFECDRCKTLSSWPICGANITSTKEPK